MMSMDTKQEITRLYFREGDSERKIARDLKISRKAVKKYLQDHLNAQEKSEQDGNTVGFPRGVEADAIAVIRQLIDRGSLVKVQDEKGNAIENIGTLEGWHNAIGLFRSGEGYRIHASQPDTLTIFPSYPSAP